MATDTVGARGKMETKAVTRLRSSARCPVTIPPDPAGEHSPISLVAYRVTESTQSWAAGSYGRLERMAKGLHWAGVDDNNATNKPYPIVFSQAKWLPVPGLGEITLGWQAAINNDNTPNTSRDTDYEVIGPGVFRFEYFYFLKDGFLSTWPWDWRTIL